MAEKKIKFVVFNKEQLDELCDLEPQVAKDFQHVQNRYDIYRRFCSKPPAVYIVCNQDEPYADAVWKTILDGEDRK
jgi:hypothetical protein